MASRSSGQRNVTVTSLPGVCRDVSRSLQPVRRRRFVRASTGRITERPIWPGLLAADQTGGYGMAVRGELPPAPSPVRAQLRWRSPHGAGSSLPGRLPGAGGAVRGAALVALGRGLGHQRGVGSAWGGTGGCVLGRGCAGGPGGRSGRPPVFTRDSSGSTSFHCSTGSPDASPSIHHRPRGRRAHVDTQNLLEHPLGGGGFGVCTTVRRARQG
jgi:hypothetical protein